MARIESSPMLSARTGLRVALPQMDAALGHYAAIGDYPVVVVACPQAVTPPLAPIPAGPLVQQTPHGTWFFAADYLDDPGLRQDRVIAIPDRELTRLQRLRDAGVSVDLVWIAHELPAHWRPEMPLPLIVPDAPRYRQLDQSLEKFVIGAAQLTFKAARDIPIATAAAGALGVGMVAGIATAGVGVDPVILGGVQHPSEPIAFWVVLAQWEWE